MRRALAFLVLSLLVFLFNEHSGGFLQYELRWSVGREKLFILSLALLAWAGLHAVRSLLARSAERAAHANALDASFLIAAAYGTLGADIYQGAPPYAWPALFKASGIIVLGIIALLARSRLLAAGLLFGAVGDALLAWSPNTFLAGAVAFLIGHLFYIALFLRAGIGARALFQPWRVIAMIAVVAFAIAMTLRLVPGESPLFVPLGLYTVVLTVMTMTSFTLPAARWLAMAGAVLFLVSDGFVAANMFHPIADPTLAYWSSFAGWMIYWAGQAAICVGALGLHKAK